MRVGTGLRRRQALEVGAATEVDHVGPDIHATHVLALAEGDPHPATLADGFFDVQACNDTNNAELFVFANASQVLLVSRLDNLGKGASGAAVQNLKLMLGL